MDSALRRAANGDALSRLATAPGPVVALAMAGLAFVFFAAGAAPGLSWANYGPDGGDLLAAAATNGVPHPSGYPLYILLLQGWLKMLGWLLPASDIAWRGNLFSGAAAASSVGITILLVWRLWSDSTPRLRAAILSGAAWMVAPLLWGQALITEVYTLHAAIFVGLAWLLLGVQIPQPPRYGLALGLVFGLGLAHHLTIGLLAPGLVYWLWSDPAKRGRRFSCWLALSLGLLPGLLLYGRILWLADPTAPVYWGGSNGPISLWWLVSGDAYRRYLFAVPLSELLSRLSGWAWVLTSQWTPIGLALALAGLFCWDKTMPRLRTLALFWALLVSAYAIGYNTADSEIYLLPVVWLMAVGLPFGVKEAGAWLDAQSPRFHGKEPVLLSALLVGLLLLAALRFPIHSLAQDEDARQFLQSATAVLEPDSLVFSSGDKETFALWYGVWASGELEQAAPGATLINVPLFQFDWYRTQIKEQYPDLPGADQGSAAAILHANAGKRPIFFAEVIAPAQPDDLTPAGLLWRYEPKR